jgi:hypothetical protein
VGSVAAGVISDDCYGQRLPLRSSPGHQGLSFRLRVRVSWALVVGPWCGIIPTRETPDAMRQVALSRRALRRVGLRPEGALSEKVFGQVVELQVVDTDRYGRTVAKVYRDGRDVNRELVREGHAWVYRKYLRDPTLLEDERRAQEAKAGIWGLPEAQRVPPWDWRHGGRLDRCNRESRQPGPGSPAGRSGTAGRWAPATKRRGARALDDVVIGPASTSRAAGSIGSMGMATVSSVSRSVGRCRSLCLWYSRMSGGSTRISSKPIPQAGTVQIASQLSKGGAGPGAAIAFRGVREGPWFQRR